MMKTWHKRLQRQLNSVVCPNYLISEFRKDFGCSCNKLLANKILLHSKPLVSSAQLAELIENGTVSAATITISAFNPNRTTLRRDELGLPNHLLQALYDIPYLEIVTILNHQSTAVTLFDCFCILLLPLQGRTWTLKDDISAPQQSHGSRFAEVAISYTATSNFDIRPFWLAAPFQPS